MSRFRRRLAAVLAATAMVSVATTVPATAAERPAASVKVGAVHVDLQRLTISQAERQMTARRYTSVQLAQAYLQRIHRYEPAYNAFVTMNPDALTAAAASDARRKAGKKARPLEGVPIVVKDSIDMAGLQTTAGWSDFTPAKGGLKIVPDHDAAIVSRLKAAGAVILGKTNLPVLAGSGDNANDSANGPTYNVLNRSWAPGGSSTGTATAVAAGFAVAGIAEETGGSIQNPTAAQGLFGIKPTFALVPNSGGVPQAASTRDVFGPIAHDVRDSATILGVIAGYTSEDPKTTAAAGNVPASYTSELSSKALRGARLGLYGPGWRKDAALSPETAKLYKAAQRLIRKQGAKLVADPFRGTGFASLAKAKDGYDSRGSGALAWELDQYLQNLGPDSDVHSYKELVRKVGDPFAPGGALNYYAQIEPQILANRADPSVPASLEEFDRVRTQYLRIFDSVLRKHHLNGLVFPQATEEIGSLVGGGVSATTVSEINIAGLPAVIVPAGKYKNGKPFSLVFVGKRFTEQQLLGYAYAYRQSAPQRLVNEHLATTPGPSVN